MDGAGIIPDLVQHSFTDVDAGSCNNNTFYVSISLEFMVRWINIHDGLE